jgi:hypothetical protein
MGHETPRSLEMTTILVLQGSVLSWRRSPDVAAHIAHLSL